MQPAKRPYHRRRRAALSTAPELQDELSRQTSETEACSAPAPSAQPARRRRRRSAAHAPAPAPEPQVPLLPALSKEEINALPIGAWEGPVMLVRDEESLDEALEAMWKEPVLGFDTETRPTFTKGAQSAPALIQFASADMAWLIQLTHIPFSERIADLLASPSILKCGVAINDDMKALARIQQFAPAGVVDLALLARRKGIQAQGLRTLAANLLGFRISKSMQCSNWENSDLSAQQIKYAATDAWVGRKLYFTLA